MKKRLYLVITIVIFSFVTNSCSDDDADTQSCDVSTESYTTQSNGTVTYTVTANSGSTVTSITYEGTNGPVTVSNPGGNFNLSVNVEAGTTISLNAKGTAVKGQIRAYFTFTGNGGNEVSEKLKVCPGE
ncbi:hypothetical protein NF867_16695 [Solitalea sp. MAHUQ-68]|uniref:Uncharacterized protein n=1 Tax=Solitalea agri TaxID=2953739 RepID=A0A9X2JDU9_9SPHI|nr:hypothetical protein [Solitalea agri]MCO4294503.1 hypothetical protein [Solitalea agri]